MTPLDLAPRPKPFRNATWFVVGVEGEKTEPLYFNGLLTHGHIPRPTRVNLEILSPDHGESAPSHVVARLAERLKGRLLRPFDQVWMVVDTDQWDENLHGAVQSAKGAGWRVAVSDPCFEVWLQLHVVGEPASGSSRDVKRAWNAHGVPLDDRRWGFTDASIERAIARGEARDNGHDLPTKPGTHVHRLVRALRAP